MHKLQTSRARCQCQHTAHEKAPGNINTLSPPNELGICVLVSIPHHTTPYHAIPHLQLLEGQLQPLAEHFRVGFGAGLALQNKRRPLVLLKGMPELDLASSIPLLFRCCCVVQTK